MPDEKTCQETLAESLRLLHACQEIVGSYASGDSRPPEIVPLLAVLRAPVSSGARLRAAAAAADRRDELIVRLREFLAREEAKDA